MTRQKTVLITGCSSGIGYYCAKALQKEGYRVFATARKASDVASLQAEGLEAYQLDLDDSKSIQNAVDMILEQTGGTLFALFNNAAFGQPGAVEDLKREVLEAQFQTNVFGTHELTTKILPVMRKQGYGRIIQNSSILGFIAMRYRGAYNASKFALEGLSDTMRLELENSGIFISLIEPGPIRSQFRQNALQKFLDNIDREHTPFKAIYKKKLAALQSTKDAPFTLGEEAVYQALRHALGERPKTHYRVTKPTTFFWLLKKVISAKLLDKILRKVE